MPCVVSLNDLGQAPQMTPSNGRQNLTHWQTATLEQMSCAVNDARVLLSGFDPPASHPHSVYPLHYLL